MHSKHIHEAQQVTSAYQLRHLALILFGHLQEAEQRQAAEEAAKSGDDANDLEKAQDFGRLRTMKVQQARVTGVLLTPLRGARERLARTPT